MTNNMECKAIAIDGPAGAGKSTIAKGVAGILGFTYVDTGALYRSIAFFLLESGIDATDEKSIESKLNDIIINLDYIEGVQHVYVNETDVSDKIRKEQVGNLASKISALSIVRKKLLDTQRNIAAKQPVIMDGRDIGTVVLKNAKLKIFLTASVEERVKRRVNQLLDSGESPNEEKIKEDIINRDYQDSHREIAPLKQAEDAVLLDTSNLTIDEVINKIVSLYADGDIR